MGIPKGNEKRGKIRIDGDTYDILTIPISDDNNRKIYNHGKKYGCIFPMFFSAKNYVNYLWVIENNKLYLKEVSFVTVKRTLMLTRLKKFSIQKLFLPSGLVERYMLSSSVKT